MRTYDISRPPELINIGFDGENKWRPRGFNCTDWLQKHPDGIITLWIQPEGVKKAFPVSTTKTENIIIWYPLSEELYPGSGKLQLEIQDGEFIGKSDTINFEVNKSLVSGGAHPDSQPSWATQMINDVTAQADRAVSAAERAEQASGTEAISEAIEDYFDEHPVVVEETDPTVPAWAKQPTKPTYTAAEVGAMPDSYTPPVTSVNGKTGAVVLDAEDVGALPDSTVIPIVPTKVSELNNDAGYLTAHQSLAAYRTSADQDTIDAAQDTAIAAKYSKPADGIPASDLASTVQTSLGKADTALQSAPVTSVNGQTGDVVIEASEGITETDFPSIADITELWHSVSKLPTGAWEDYSWHQCPEAVRNYLANVDYEGIAYTESSISTYAPTPAVPATNTKPIGQTIDGVTFYNVRPNGNAPYATANKSGVLNPLDQVRWINSATSNFRDLGGWPCDGGTVKYGLLYRSGNLNAADEDLILNQLGITVECDLTADGEPAYPDKMRFIGYTSYAMYTLANTGAWQTNLRGIFDAVKCGDPVVFHCSMGADRTGTLACILEGLLGVSQSDIDKDYELTSFYAERARNGNYQGGTTDWAHLITQILALSGDSFRDKCVTFVRSLGFTVAEINTFRHAMIDGSPEDIVLPTATYTVTNTLSGCSTNNVATSAEEGSSYSAAIAPNSGYTLTGATVSITMGGTDITSSAYSNGVISIASVTGNVVIAITAVEVPSYTNQIPISTDVNGNVYNTTGYREDYRLNSSGAETAFSGSVVTGFIPFTLGQEIVFNKFSGSESSNGGIYFYDSTHTLIASNKVNTLISNGHLTAGEPLDYTPTSPIYDSGSGTMKSLEGVSYIRVSAFSSNPAALSCGILGEGQQGGDDPTPTVNYTVTNTLTNCSSSNNAASVESGQSYSAVITANSGYTLTGATVSITMGGTDITSTAYNNGAISIDSVTENIVIAITAATESQMKELFDPAAATLNQRFSSSGSYSALDGNFCTDYIPVSGLDASEPWRIHIKDTTDSTVFRASVGYESVLFCNSDKSIINSNYGRLAINTNTSGTNTLCKHSDSAGGVYVDINRTGDGNPIPSTFFDLSQVAYIRVCMCYSSGTAIPDSSILANVSITADNITN